MNFKNKKSFKIPGKINFLSALCHLWLIFFLLLGCSAKPVDSGKSSEGKPQTGLETKTITITTPEGIIPVEAELARTDEEHSTGLMYRTELEDGKGMLFIFETDEVRSFWMKNTLIPLSIAFITYDGRIVEIKDMYPNNTNSVLSSRSVRYALEVPQGWFSRAGVQPGDIIILP